MKKIHALLVMVIMIFALVGCPGCPDNFMAREFGGDITVNLPKERKLVNATWKETDLWLLTRPMRADEQAETWKFSEDSTFGVMEGTVTIIESR